MISSGIPGVLAKHGGKPSSGGSAQPTTASVPGIHQGGGGSALSSVNRVPPSGSTARRRSTSSSALPPSRATALRTLGRKARGGESSSTPISALLPLAHCHPDTITLASPKEMSRSELTRDAVEGQREVIQAVLDATLGDLLEI